MTALSPVDRSRRRLALLPLAALAGGCAQLISRMPSTGPTRDEIEQAAPLPGTAAVQLIELDDLIARRLLGQRRQRLFSETLGQAPVPQPEIGPGDSLEIHIWEAPPATLFGTGTADPRAVSLVRPATLPEQTVDRAGYISVPFAGRVRAGGLSAQAVEAEIARLLRGKANQPEVVVRLLRNSSAVVTVVGEVAQSVRMPLTASGERLLDALAAAGGVRQPVSKMTLQVTRGNNYHSLPLDVVIRDPRQNVPMKGGDVVTALFQPLSFTALGATGKNEEINFEAQGINLAQALARAGGLVDSRSSPQGVFVFRFEPEPALTWPRQPVATTPDGLVPVVYRLDLNNPQSFFVMQSFFVNDKDVLYVSNAPATDMQKFLNLVFSAVYPLVNIFNATR